MLKKLITRWKAPTPIFWRKVGTALATFSAVISGTAFAANKPWLGYAALAATIISKEITNLAVQTDPPKTNQP